MYLELIAAAIGAQKNLADNYIASYRLRELGYYILAHHRVTLAFFELVEPPQKLSDLHAAFLRWQRLAVQTLSEELNAQNSNVGSDTSLEFAKAGKQFIESFIDLTQGATPSKK